jgi:hypothetical protein
MLGKHLRRPNHPYFLNGIDELPEPLSELVISFLPKEEEITGIFVIPPEAYKRGFRWQLNPLQALVFSKHGLLHVSEPEKEKARGSGTWILCQEILKIKLSLILLYGKLEIWGLRNNQVLTIKVEYNTVEQANLSPHIKDLLRGTWTKNLISQEPPNEDKTFKNFITTSFSFYHGLVNEAIQPDEIVLGIVFQPEIQIPWLKFFHRKISPQTAIAFTDQQTILLQEDLKFQTHHEWIFTFIPNYRIERIDQESDQYFHKQVIHLVPDIDDLRIDFLLVPQNYIKWAEVWNKQ